MGRGWIHGTEPPGAGYYLGAWQQNGRWVVSELWFNPQSLGTGWWPIRGYLHWAVGRQTGITIHVRAWMPMPEFRPEQIFSDDVFVTQADIDAEVRFYCVCHGWQRPASLDEVCPQIYASGS
jgi:hypothetical protein